MAGLTSVEETATILLLKTCKFEDPLVAKFHPMGYIDWESWRRFQKEIMRWWLYLPYFQVPDDSVGDLTKCPSMRTIDLLNGIPPLQQTINKLCGCKKGRSSQLDHARRPSPTRDPQIHEV